jgi:hypothetical protein
MLASIAVPLLGTVIAAVSATTPPQTCSSDAFSIDDQTIVARICAPLAVRVGSDGKARIPLVETFTSRDQTISHATTLDYQENQGEFSRTIDDAALDTLGIARSLHLTIGFKPGTVLLEHALLTPGARALK